MVFQALKNKFRRSKIVDRCHTGEDGKTYCERVRVHPNNTESELANFSFVMDTDCNIVEDSSEEKETGQLEKLRNHILPNVTRKCQARPPDY